MSDNKLSILTIEDDPDVRHSIAAFYSDYGHTVYEAENGVQGLAMLESVKPDLIFTDLWMPEMGGLDVIEAISRKTPETPIIVISGTGSVRDTTEAHRRGAWDYIAKPVIDFGELELAIQRAMERVELSRANHLKHEVMLRTIAEQSTRLQTIEGQDPLTGLPNRSGLRQLFYGLVSSSAQVVDISIMLIGLDNFRLVIEASGRDAAEQLIKALVEKLNLVLSPCDVLARLGTDEFVIMVTDGARTPRLISELTTLFASPLQVSGPEIFLTSSVGIALFPQDGESVERLIQNADVAMSKARSLGKNRFQYYSHELSAMAQERLMLETHLHHALERDQYILYYQPQVDSITKVMTGMEVLLRWQMSAEERLVPPSVFIPILEETALIVPVGEWILKSACRQYAQWRSAGMAPLRMSVNISACQFHSGNLPQVVREALDESGMEPELLCLEITESVVVQDINSTIAIMQELADMGLELSLDDFGTGFSSLSYLNRMPLHELKIDSSFVKNLPGDKSSISIVDSILELARGLELNVVAEGVELAEQGVFLRARGCQMLQGYLYSKPLASDDFKGFWGRADVVN